MNSKYKMLLYLAGLNLLCCISSAHAEDGNPSATPYRPTVSNPADLSEPGWLEMEFGGQRIHGGSDKRRDSFPALAKLAFTQNWGILVGGELGVRRTDLGGVMHRGGGDTTFLVKHRIPTANDSAAWGIEAGCKFPTAKETIGSGKTDYILNGIYSADFSGNHLDLNIGATRLGAITDAQGLYQYSWASSLSRNLDEKWGMFGELSGSYQRATPPMSQFMAGLTYNYNRQVVFDIGAVSGIAKASQDWAVFAGITVLVAKLW